MYTTYTHRNAVCITNSNTDDKTMITPNYRKICEYFCCFDPSLEERWQLKAFIKKFSKTHRRKLTYLDCGAGQGKAIHTLLKHPKYGKTVDKCHGISLQLFQNVSKVLKKHPGKVKWFHGNALGILKTLPSNSYDLITDLWGAYFYTPDHHTLVKEYHRILKPSGRCYIMFYNKQSALDSGPLKDSCFEKFLSQTAPETFKLSFDKAVMVIKKQA